MRSSASIAKPTVVSSRPTTPWTARHYDRNGKLLEAAAGKTSESKKPYKKSEGDKGMVFMQSMDYFPGCTYLPMKNLGSKKKLARHST